MNEIWKDIKNYEGLYQISNYGKIKSLYNYKRKGTNILTPHFKKGYLTIGLRKNKKRKWYSIHRLVAQTFIPNANNLPQVNHKDEDKLNNKVDNLEWCTVSYNNSYGTRINKVIAKTGKKIYQYTLDGEFIKEFSSISEASRKCNINKSNISSCCLKRKNYRHAGGYIWRYKKEGGNNDDRIQ